MSEQKIEKLYEILSTNIEKHLSDLLMPWNHAGGPVIIED